MTDKVTGTVYEAKLTVTGLSDGTIRVSTDYTPEPVEGDGNPVGYIALSFAAENAVEFLNGMSLQMLNMEPESDSIN